MTEQHCNQAACSLSKGRLERGFDKLRKHNLTLFKKMKTEKEKGIFRNLNTESSIHRMGV